MLQIIGWMGCLYLVFRALDMIASTDRRNEDGTLRISALIAIILAFAGALVFSLLLLGVGQYYADQISKTAEAERRTTRAQAITACMETKATAEEMVGCYQ